MEKTEIYCQRRTLIFLNFMWVWEIIILALGKSYKEEAGGISQGQIGILELKMKIKMKVFILYGLNGNNQS